MTVSFFFKYKNEYKSFCRLTEMQNQNECDLKREFLT